MKNKLHQGIFWVIRFRQPTMDPLLVDIIHFYPVENAQPHNTKKFEALNIEPATDVTTTIVRRGQPFNGVVRFNRPYDESDDTVQLLFTLGDKPAMDTQGSVFLKRDAVPDKHSWSAKIVEVGNEDNTISFEISTPVNLPVGSWALRVVTRLKSSQAREVYDFDQDFYILFNPWNAESPEFYTFQSHTFRLFKIMNFSDRSERMFLSVLNAVRNMRGDPVKVSRVISRIVNSNDDQGVLIGRWDGEYDDGTAPSEWTGSVDILAQYLEFQQEVAYGQCWVFAGVVTTGKEDMVSAFLSQTTCNFWQVVAVFNDITFKLRDIDTVPIGKEFRVIVDIDNNSEEGRNIKAALTATSVFYNGVRAELVKKIEGKIFVGPTKHEEISILVKPDDYLPKLVEYCNIKISAMAIVDETKQSWADDDDFQVLKPNINIKVRKEFFNLHATELRTYRNRVHY
ncbi:jg11617 [Pararge aegeria aegeria]|uniref:Jg11617 protein n=1 Tax=Pararge aegeria aegeria TaxID=348720 RepID=A0A8S4RZK7_9NEOP|nr:jg11617 [Pararge aegeria aegeria]